MNSGHTASASVDLSREEIAKLRHLVLTRMFRVSKLMDKWGGRAPYANDKERPRVLGFRDMYRGEFALLEALWDRLRKAQDSQVG